MIKDDRDINRIRWGNVTLIVAVIAQTLLLWNEYSWYEAVVPYVTLISLVALAITVLCYVPVKEALRDKYMWLVAAACIVAGINILVTDSGKGAWLTAADVLLVIYLSDKIRLTNIMMWFMYVYIGFYFYYWTYDVKGYFKGYNTNYGGLVLITGFVFAITGIIAFREKLKKDSPAGAKFLSFFLLFMFAWGYNIVAWYRARCALLSLIVFAVLMLVPHKWWKNRVFYSIITYSATIGSVLLSLVYVWLGKLSDSVSLRIFYKDIISGRNEIWADLWGAFVKQPLTGIGSSYSINVRWMTIFEVHNGLLDILIVHGLIVFAITCFMLIRVLLGLRDHAAGSVVSKSATAAVFAILAGSFAENFFIVPPFLLCTLVLIAIARSVCYNHTEV